MSRIESIIQPVNERFEKDRQRKAKAEVKEVVDGTVLAVFFGCLGCVVGIVTAIVPFIILVIILAILEVNDDFVSAVAGGWVLLTTAMGAAIGWSGRQNS